MPVIFLRRRHFGLAGFALAWMVLSSAQPARAHPLGNFTINHLSVLWFGRDRATVRYVLDMAEIPTYALMREHAASGRMTARDLDLWAQTQAKVTATELQLRVNGADVPLATLHATARTRPGAGGLPTLYFVVDYRAALPPSAASGTLDYRDSTFTNRLGWHDVIVAPQTEPTHELTVYPNALLGSPRRLTEIRATRENGRAPHVVAVDGASMQATSPAPGAPSGLGRSNQLADMLVASRNGPWFVALTLLVAILLGALHALEPGHGKTLLAVSLVGARATFSQAAILAGALTVAHTAGVLALGFAIILLKGTLVPETIYPWITLLSGLAVAIIGARAIGRQIQARLPIAHVHDHGHSHAHDHAHAHEHHPHDHSHAVGHGNAHDHSHDDEAHARSHAIPGSAPLKFGPTVLAAMSGGVAPCPAALVVLFAAISQNVLAYGLVAIVFFSVGLASTLTGLGIGVVRGATWLQNRPAFERFVRYGPLVSAIVIATIGAIMVGQGAVEGGYVSTPFLVSAIAGLAIAGYAFSHPFAHRRVEAA